MGQFVEGPGEEGMGRPPQRDHTVVGEKACWPRIICIYVYMYIYIYVYICMCIYIYLCVEGEFLRKIDVQPKNAK